MQTKTVHKLAIGIILFLQIITVKHGLAQQKRARDYGIHIGVMPTGAQNAITDVAGVLVGHQTLIEGTSVRTGVTAVLPHSGNLFQEKVPAGLFIGNGFGKLAGTTQLMELGNIESPIILTNTLNVAEGIAGVLEYTLSQEGNEKVQSVNAVVGETNDGYLNDIRGRHVTKEDVLQAIQQASNEKPAEGAVGAGTGTVCFGFKGGIGTASRKLPQSLGGYTVGVLVQTNFGGVLQIAGVNVGKEIGKFEFSDKLQNNGDGSCIVVVATDAPLDNRNLNRLAKRAFMGLAKTGGIASNGSGDYVLSFSTAKALRIPFVSPSPLQTVTYLTNDAVSPLFMAAIEATEEAIINALFAARTTSGKDGRTIPSLPLEKVLSILKNHNALAPQD